MTSRLIFGKNGTIYQKLIRGSNFVGKFVFLSCIIKCLNQNYYSISKKSKKYNNIEIAISENFVFTQRLLTFRNYLWINWIQIQIDYYSIKILFLDKVFKENPNEVLLCPFSNWEIVFEKGALQVQTNNWAFGNYCRDFEKFWCLETCLKHNILIFKQKMSGIYFDEVIVFFGLYKIN